MKNINYAYIILICTICFGSCNETSQEKPVLASGLFPDNMDTTVRPGDNFQMYVNGTWINNTEIPADKSSYSIGSILQEQSEENVKVIIEESAAGKFEMGTDEQKVGDLYSSYMNLEMRNELGVTPLAADLNTINQLSTKDELAGYIAYLGMVGIQTPIQLYISQDAKKPTEYAVHCWQGGLGLPDREYYFDETGKAPSIREAYMAHVIKMFELSGIENAAQCADQVMSIETLIADKHWKKEDNRNSVKTYNMFPVDSLNTLMPNFEWKNYFTRSSIADLDKIIINQPSFILGLDNIIASVDMDTWKTYLKWLVINDGAGLLNEALDNQNFDFYSTTLRGTTEQRPLWRRGVGIVNRNLGEVIGKVYVKRHFPPAAKEKMLELVGNLIASYDASITALDWMGVETKTQALDKLSKFDPKIGYPDKWKDYSSVEITPDNLYANVRSARLSVHQREIAKLGKPIDKTEWGMTPQTVNAYYNPSKNEIVFPAAILQSPFFDLGVDNAVNYGAIGAVIGHEIGHGFDDQGSTTDGDGLLRDWWTDQDKEEFKKRTNALVGQYNEFKVFEDLNVNGEFTLGENIGDLGGLSIALKAYKLSLKGGEAPVIDGYTGIQRVFIGWAQAWRRISRDEALRIQVKTDPHSPADFRVNGVVRNIPEFYEAFNIQPTDSLYLAPEDRVKIW